MVADVAQAVEDVVHGLVAARAAGTATFVMHVVVGVQPMHAGLLVCLP